MRSSSGLRVWHTVSLLPLFAPLIETAHFCFLEQMLPCGSNHPFARTMLAHFHSLSTPLKSVSSYPTLSSQVSRFECRGWSHVDACDLFEFWKDFVSLDEK